MTWSIMSTRIGINGFGRIGRLALRAAWNSPDLTFAHINELKADARAEAATRRDSIKQHLEEVETYLKDGWDSVSTTVEQKRNSWLDRKN